VSLEVVRANAAVGEEAESAAKVLAVPVTVIGRVEQLQSLPFIALGHGVAHNALCNTKQANWLITQNPTKNNQTDLRLFAQSSLPFEIPRPN